MPKLQQTDGVVFVVPSYKLGNWELRPTVDRKRASDVGMTAADVGYAVLAIVNGAKVADFRELSGNELDLTLRGAPQYRAHIENLEGIPLWTPRGGTVTLGQVAPLEPASGFNVIEHTEQQRSVQLQCVVADDAAIGLVKDTIQAQIVDAAYGSGDVPPDYIVDLRGTARDLDRMWEVMKWSLLLALVITYLLMSALFESFAHPIVIMLTVPLAMVGGYGMFYAVMFWNLLVMGTPPPQLDVVTMLGFIILIGIVVNNAILVVAQALNFHKNDGLPITEAIVKSVDSRIRPIFMSTLTSILGMLPLVFRPGAGSELYQGLGAVVVGGLAVSTVFTLILTPVVFSFGIRLTEWLHRLAARVGLIVAE
jgi:HAE1 family hydrophobic/amphiphilic exporter-1